MDIRKNICTTLLITIALSIITIVISGIVLGCNGDEEPIYKAISLYGNYFSGVCTIIAAIVATWLYTDWRVSLSAGTRSDLAKDVKRSFIKLKSEMDAYYNQANMYAHYSEDNNKELCETLRTQLKRDFPKLAMDFRVSLKLYENTYNETLLETDTLAFNKYFYSINTVFTEIISRSESHSSYLLKCAVHLETSKIEFEERFYNPILNQLTPHINLNRY